MVKALKSIITAWIVAAALFMAQPGFADTIPEELFQGWVRFQVESERYLDALVLMDEAYQRQDPVSYAAALKGFNLKSKLTAELEHLPPKDKELSSYEWFTLGKIFYYSDECIPALKAFKRLKNKLSLEEKQEWAFYRANCFIKLGSDTRAAQVLSDILSGPWIAHAYYNLAMSYAATNSSKTKPLVALKVASSLNAGKTLVEKELNDRVNFAAGAILLNDGKPDMAIDFFKKVHLESMVAPQALYLNGVAQLELNDFRSATQSWHAVKKHALVQQGVAESLLAIPYAFERGGYVSQAIESYVEASDYFEKELDMMTKISGLIDKQGFRQTLIEENGMEGLEWFLTKDVARNTVQASYYSYLIENDDIYRAVQLLEELKLLEGSLTYWAAQLDVFVRSLNNKKRDFARLSGGFKRDEYAKRIAELQARHKKLDGPLRSQPGMTDALEWSQLSSTIKQLDKRLGATVNAIKGGKKALDQRLAKAKSLQKQLRSKRKTLGQLLADVDNELKALAKDQLAILRRDMLAHYERSEEGLIEILQTIAESKQARRNRLDGRYQ